MRRRGPGRARPGRCRPSGRCGASSSARLRRVPTPRGDPRIRRRRRRSARGTVHAAGGDRVREPVRAVDDRRLLGRSPRCRCQIRHVHTPLPSSDISTPQDTGCHITERQRKHIRGPVARIRSSEDPSAHREEGQDAAHRSLERVRGVGDVLRRLEQLDARGGDRWSCTALVRDARVLRVDRLHFCAAVRILRCRDRPRRRRPGRHPPGSASACRRGRSSRRRDRSRRRPRRPRSARSSSPRRRPRRLRVGGGARRGRARGRGREGAGRARGEGERGREGGEEGARKRRRTGGGSWRFLLGAGRDHIQADAPGRRRVTFA